MKPEDIANDWEEFIAIWNHLSPTQKSIIIQKASTRRNRKTYITIILVVLIYIATILVKCKF